MTDDPLNIKRIRDSAPYRKSMSLTELDLQRAVELERIYNSRFPGEAPFNFSKTISKSIELAYLQMLEASSTGTVSIQRSLSGGIADESAIKEREEQKRQQIEKPPFKVKNSGNHNKFQKLKRGLH